MKIMFFGLLIFLASCEAELFSRHIDWAEKSCEANGGVDRIHANSFFSPVVTCKNGGRFYSYGKGLK